MSEIIYQLFVTLTHSHYPVIIGRGLLQDAALIRPFIHGSQTMIVSNALVASHYLETLHTALQSLQYDHVLIADGEQHKNLASFEQVITALQARGHHRDTTMLALGGGIIGDIAGFAAASYQRGVAYIQIPTTLLAQVDAAIGGKTAVNYGNSKNLIGAFHQPTAVIVDLDVLVTLGEREFRAGIAEIIKYAVIIDASFFEWLEQNINLLLQREPSALAYAVYRSCQIKAAIVEKDEKEQGIRAILNFGHTFAHAFEAGTAYQRYLHGEAVALGMLYACKLSVRLGMLPPLVLTKLTNMLTQVGLPQQLPPELAGDPPLLLALMAMDKKVISNHKRLILLAELGKALIRDDIADEEIIAIL